MPPDPINPNATGADQRVCPVCHRQFMPSPRQPRQRYCSTNCRQAAWRHRQRSGPATPPADRSQLEPPPVAIQGCPHCSRPIAVVALLVTPQAARAHPTTSPEVIAIEPH